jgi:hypothetical protein
MFILFFHKVNIFNAYNNIKYNSMNINMNQVLFESIIESTILFIRMVALYNYSTSKLTPEVAATKQWMD